MPGDTLIDILRRVMGADGKARPTPEAAKYLLALEFAPDDHRRIEELADKCNEGQLTPEERREYEGYGDLTLLLVVLQSKSRMALAAQAAATSAAPAKGT